MLRWIGLTALVAIAVTWGRTAIDLEVYRAAGVVPVLMTVISASALVTTCVIVARRYQVPEVVGGAVAAASVLLEPLMTNFLFGQINLVLMLLVVADCLLPKTFWPRGLLIGIAAAIKPTPAAFLLFFLVRKQWKPILVALGGFVAAGLVTLAVTSGNSTGYWTDVLFRPDRTTVPSWGDNQSLRGMLARLGAPDWSWLLMVAPVLAVAWLSVHRLRAQGEDVSAVLVIAVAGLLVSPVSWGHHWSWIASALVAAVITLWRLRNRWLWALFGIALVPFAIGPHRFLPRAAAEQLGWTPLDHLVGNCYVVIGLVLRRRALMRRRGGWSRRGR
ncbi:glycosyltransferase 87 family protein [Allokutzneria sp. A3M-2-11 16]|uniref:glycosyltransferase 87 family protein n=1 Tax=Allokutzneria sp. A3M-2-11 16 TaxID=2962043 RepID=UPI0020B6B3B0|nr:glycosyltransferase 87 family protein [Allokutzneria sp. A3M-2-11 16]MCP3801448.1 glycosyltransferase 87 family protein [Allokutzneria sp. A3M-2-11 16]